jgi:hypothetical protein
MQRKLTPWYTGQQRGAESLLDIYDMIGLREDEFGLEITDEEV